jgi:hypothetical protein
MAIVKCTNCEHNLHFPKFSTIKEEYLPCGSKYCLKEEVCFKTCSNCKHYSNLRCLSGCALYKYPCEFWESKWRKPKCHSKNE